MDCFYPTFLPVCFTDSHVSFRGQIRIYQERVEAFKQEIREVHNGTHPDFEEAIVKLEQQRDEIIRRAELFRDYQLERVEKLYQQEHQATIAEYTVSFVCCQLGNCLTDCEC